jgi:hypothetical protein
MLIGYYEVLARIHQHIEPATYLEIGVHQGHSLALADPRTRAVGVDPAADIQVPLPPSVQLIAATSDQFFVDFDVRSVFGGLPVDLAFIDGLHLFEQALRDFLNIERWAAPDATVLVHDCLPIDTVTSSRERTTVVWSGDVWKLVACLRRYRPDLAIATIDVAPTGLAVITNLNPDAPCLPLEEMYAEFVPLTFVDLNASGINEVLNRVDNNWTTVRALLGR